jgi:uncharacterized membrane protein YqjE
MAVRMFDRLRRALNNLTGLLGVRLELFGLELQDEVNRLLGHLAVLFALVVAAAFALLFASVVVLILAAHNNCLLPAAFGMAIFYGVIAVICAGYLSRRMRQAPEAFALTRAEFERDRVALGRTPEGKA